ncbi:conserved hypothetical protein [uncultured Desulfobacterium sp.]|uniref:Radical SAM core domain-containing protein n=1 Tax=uncultured Desulfobacterium sp. TaxID=201089 RepID=A0A445N2C5_9BACT|nr:conserved hypothetical protein [uncultured Desulfobacterium sp.]
MKLINDIKDSTLRAIARKVEDDVPVSRQDAVYMLQTNNILDLATIAQFMRLRLHGDVAYYGVNMNLNYTNICELRCPLCAFSCNKGDKKAYLLSLDDIEKKVKIAVSYGIDEVHIVGGLNQDLDIAYFEQMFTSIKSIKPDIHIVALTAVEYDYIARKNNLSLEEVFRRLINAGVNAMPGGGAEIFSPEIRNIIAPKKISGKRWLEVMRTAHNMGLKTNATMLYNHIESAEDIADHLWQIRALQDETNGFKTFVPLQFHGKNTAIFQRHATTGYDDIRIYATSRIFLHNVPHLKVLWMYVGEKMAQVLLRLGVDDMGATYHDEKIVHSAGANTPDYGSEPYLRSLIKEVGLIPVRTTAAYNKIDTGNNNESRSH